MDEHLKQRIAIHELNKKNYKGPHCCFDLDSMLEEDETAPYNVKYNPIKREYYLKSSEGPYIRTLDYCPWCGKKLPVSVRDEWHDILEAMDLNPNDPRERKKIPQEFLTDQWWKKRGL